MAFRTISRSDNRALAVPFSTREKRERKRERLRVGRETRRHPLTRFMYPTQHRRISYKPFNNECLARYRSYTIVKMRYSWDVFSILYSEYFYSEFIFNEKYSNGDI